MYHNYSKHDSYQIFHDILRYFTHGDYQLDKESIGIISKC